MASKDELLSSITPDMRLTRDFFLNVYGYELTWPGFAENVLTRMEILGCSKARDYYTCVVAEYEHNHEKEWYFCTLIYIILVRKKPGNAYKI